MDEIICPALDSFEEAGFLSGSRAQCAESMPLEMTPTRIVGIYGCTRSVDSSHFHARRRANVRRPSLPC